MRSITHCPNCQTQFFVTEDQLNQHQGQVRCGQCLHVFNAKEQFIEDTQTEISVDLISSSSHLSATIETKPTPASGIQPSSPVTATQAIALEDRPYNFEDEIETLKPKNKPARKISQKLLAHFALLLSISAIAQSVYFLRNDIAMYYPAMKPYLVQACQHLACSVDLPKKIQFIVIDDSDMQEDTSHVGLMHLSSTIINQAAFNQAYPDLEITLTDVDDKPKLRRIFKPKEYLKENTVIANGIAAGEEVKINLAMTTNGETVAGYRVFVTY